jgi:phosphoribosyl-ATP pyrophosphohydrolase
MAQTYKYVSNDNYEIYVEVINDEIYHMFFYHIKTNNTFDIPINVNTSQELYHTAVMVVEDGVEITDNYDLL